MAILFDDASSQYLVPNPTVAVVSAYPFSMGCWFRSNDATVNQHLLTVFQLLADNQNFWSLAARGAVAGDPVRFACTAAGSNNVADTTTGFTAGVWHHALAVGTSATSRTVYIDGGSSATATTNLTPGSLTQTAIGGMPDTGPDNYASADIGEAAFWSLALTAADAASLFTGASPLLVRPEGLVAYWPLLGNNVGAAGEPDLIGGAQMNWTNGPVKSDHPRIFYPCRRHSGKQAAAVAAGGPGRIITGGLLQGGQLLGGRLVA